MVGLLAVQTEPPLAVLELCPAANTPVDPIADGMGRAKAVRTRWRGPEPEVIHDVVDIVTTNGKFERRALQLRRQANTVHVSLDRSDIHRQRSRSGIVSFEPSGIRKEFSVGLPKSVAQIIALAIEPTRRDLAPGKFEIV